MYMKRAFRYFLISFLSIFFTLVAVGIIYIVADTHSRIEIEDGQTFSSDEVEALVDEAKAEGRKSVLDSIRESLESGNTIVSVLKSLYPEYIVVAANSKYNFVPIDDTLAKNNFDIEIFLKKKRKENVLDIKAIAKHYPDMQVKTCATYDAKVAC